MFSGLRQNSLFYILDKNNGLKLKIGQVISVTSPQYTTINPTIDVSVKTDSEILEFKKLPANMSIANYGNDNIIVAEDKTCICNEVESLLKLSNKAIEDVPYHKSVIENGETIMAQLNPRIAKEKEQEAKIKSLESKVGNIETCVLDMKTMVSQLLNKNQNV